jgi:hypothetical protein
MPTPHPPPVPGEMPTATSRRSSPTSAASGAGRPPGRRSPAVLVAVIAGVALVATVGVIIAVARSSGDDDAGGLSPGASVAPSSAPIATTSTTAAPAPTTAPAASPPAVQPTAPRPTTSAPSTSVPANVLDLGSGVHLPLAAGWQRVSGPDDPLTISDGITWYSSNVTRRPAGEGPQPVLQDVVHAIDAVNAAVSYSPVRFIRTVGGPMPADEYALVYSAIGLDGARFSGAIQAFLRGDGLVMVVEAWQAAEAWPDEPVIPAEITDAVERSLTGAPKLGAAETLPVVAPFRLSSVHPVVSPRGLAGFTLPPGFEAWPPTTDGDLSVAGATNGSTDLIAIAMPAPDSVEEVFASVAADLDQRYPGLVIDTPSPQGSRDGATRLGAGFAGTLGGRPIAGGVDVWLVEGPTAYAFAYVYHADIEADGANPEAVATQFAYAAYADSF